MEGVCGGWEMFQIFVCWLYFYFLSFAFCLRSFLLFYFALGKKCQKHGSQGGNC